MEHAEKQLLEAMRRIKASIGNVDHTKGLGLNSARMRGDMLNKIRQWADVSIRSYVTRKQIQLLKDNIEFLKKNFIPDREVHEASVAGMNSLIISMEQELAILEKETVTLLI